MCYTGEMFRVILLYTLLFITISIGVSQEEKDRKIVFNEVVYDPFFAATIKDNEGERFNVSRIAFFDEFNEKKYFFWVRRNSGLYTVSFKNIKSVIFSSNDFADDRYEGFTRATLNLISGESHLVYIKTTGHLEGFEELFASPVTFYLHYNLIESIEFAGNGNYYYCPFCETVYFDPSTEICPYDKTPLVEGVLSDSDR